MKKTLFINCNYTYLWIGKVISQLGDKFYSLALAWWILEKTNSPGIMGFYLLVSLLPGLILGLYAGAMVDRLNRKSILITTDILRGFLILFVVIMSMLDLLHVWHVFVISTFISLVTAFFEPTVQAIIPQIVAKEQLKDANSLSQMVNGLCTVLGPILGAIAVSQFGMTYVFLFNGISYFASAILSKLITLNSGPLLQKKTTNILEDVKEGIYYL